METKFAAIAQTVNHRLKSIFDELLHYDNQGIFFSIPPLEISNEVKNITLRGGKRFRAALIANGFELLAPQNTPLGTEVVDAACAMELLQTYFLIHDDIMDNDTIRRGGPSAHASLEAKTGNPPLAKNLAILSGDLACALHENILAHLDCAPEIKFRVMQIFSRMHMDVVFGQTLDLQNLGTPEEIVQRKTASYTTIGPLCIGAALGGANESHLRQIANMALPLGIAFQYRDDIISLFGKPEVTGKPTGSDLKNNKQTHLLEDALAHVEQKERMQIERVLNYPQATDEQIQTALRIIETCGSKSRCEHKIEQLCDDVIKQLDSSQFEQEGKTFLLWLCKRITTRNA